MVALLSMAGCASNGHEGGVDHGDGVDTPDVLLQDTDGKSVSYGDRDYGLDSNAKRNDQQIKPDPLIAGIGNGGSERRATAAGRSETNQPNTVARQPGNAAAKPKQNVRKPQTEEQRLKRDSALEVGDPLLDEVDQ